MQTPSFHIAMKNTIGDGVLELQFLDTIANSTQFDWTTGERLTTNLVEETIAQVKAASPSKIKCTIDSIGGDASIGLAIYNFLKSYNAKVEVEIIGMAGSIASVMAMAASKGKLSIARNAFMVIHKAWGAGIGNSDELRQAADVIDKYTAQVVDIYAQRSGKTTEEIAALIENGDYWMSGVEAVEQGFADVVFNDNAQLLVAAHLLHLPKQYKNVPADIKDKLRYNHNSNNSNSIAVKQHQQNIQPVAKDHPLETIDESSLKTPYSFFNHLKQEFMHIVNQIKETFAGVKDQYMAPATEDKAVEQSIALVEIPTLLSRLEAALTPTLTAIENKVEQIEKEKIQSETFASVQTELSNATKTIEQLQADIANLLGGSAQPTIDTNNTIQPIGHFVKH